MEIRYLTALTALFLIAGSAWAAAEEENWVQIPAIPATWADAAVAAAGKKALLVLDTPASLRLRGSLLPPPLPGLPAPMKEQTREWLELFPKQKETGLTIEWLGEPAKEFQRSIDPEDRRLKSISEAGDTTITRTILASREDDTVFIHLLAGHPGALSFRVKLDPPGGGKVTIEDRRQLIHTPEEGPASHVWVFPFESEVTREGDTLTVRGEGEALVVWNFGEKEAISGTWERLAARHDPGQTPPDPIKIWHGVVEKHLKSAKNSP